MNNQRDSGGNPGRAWLTSAVTILVSVVFLGIAVRRAVDPSTISANAASDSSATAGFAADCGTGGRGPRRRRRCMRRCSARRQARSRRSYAVRRISCISSIPAAPPANPRESCSASEASPSRPKPANELRTSTVCCHQYSARPDAFTTHRQRDLKVARLAVADQPIREP